MYKFVAQQHICFACGDDRVAPCVLNRFCVPPVLRDPTYQKTVDMQIMFIWLASPGSKADQNPRHIRGICADCLDQETLSRRDAEKAVRNPFKYLRGMPYVGVRDPETGFVAKRYLRTDVVRITQVASAEASKGQVGPMRGRISTFDDYLRYIDYKFK